ncbi:MAG TPA: UDP-N-acetylglucosamine 2-epimerase (non-hydrolyzing) [Chryseosolibacter sp.]
MKTILIIVGTRPEAIKLMPVYFALKHQHDVKLVSTGQHKEMLKQILDFFEITPDVELNAMVENQSLATITGRLFLELNKVIESIQARMLVVQGDTTSAMVAAMVAYYHKIPVAHVEAGLRSGQKYSPFPEEINRAVISLVSTLNFAPTKKAAENLAGFPNVHVVGNTILDSLLFTLDKLKTRKHSERFRKMVAPGQDLILITAHRRESFGQGLENICRAVEILCAKYPTLKFVFPVHLNPKVKERVTSVLGQNPSISLIEPLVYDEMVELMCKARIILTDSGGIQEEAPALKVPLIVMREVTERPEGIDAGCAVLAGTTTQGLVSAFDRIHTNPSVYNAMKNANNPYGDGKSSERIAAIIHEFL